MISLINYLREKLICQFENTNIFEMAKHRTDFRNEIESIVKIIFQRYCLVRYCVRYDRDIHAANNMIWFVLTYMRLKNIKDTEGTFDTSKLVTNKSAYKISFKEFCKLFAAEQETVTSLV